MGFEFDYKERLVVISAGVKEVLPQEVGGAKLTLQFHWWEAVRIGIMGLGCMFQQSTEFCIGFGIGLFKYITGRK